MSALSPYSGQALDGCRHYLRVRLAHHSGLWHMPIPILITVWADTIQSRSPKAMDSC